MKKREADCTEGEVGGINGRCLRPRGLSCYVMFAVMSLLGFIAALTCAKLAKYVVSIEHVVFFVCSVLP